MNEHGSTTQNVIILSILVLIAILVALLLYRTVSDESANIERAAQEVSDITLFSERECPQGQVRNAQTNECETDQTGIRECPQGQVRNLANECVAEETELPDCPQGQVRNTQTNECEQAPCADNEIRNDEGQCVVGTCPQGQVRNAQTNECVPESTDDGGGGDVDEPLTYWTGLVESIHTGDGYTCVMLGEYSSADGFAYLDDDTYSEIRCWGYDLGIAPIGSVLYHTTTSPPISYFENGAWRVEIRADNRIRTSPALGRHFSSIPIELAGLSGTAFKDFSTSYSQFCKITASNAVICYGDNNAFQLGLDGTSITPYFSGAFHWPEPEVGQHYLQTQHAVYDPPFPQPGYLDNPPTIEMRDHFWTDSDPYDDAIKRQGGVKGGIASETPVSLWTEKDITCAITASDKVFCWGSSSYCTYWRFSPWTSDGFTDGTDEGSRFPITPCEYTHLSTEIPALSGQGVTQLAIGDEHMCALYPRSTGATEGNVKCWGSNDRSQLGAQLALVEGSDPERYLPSIRKSDTPVAPYDPNNLLVNAKKIVAGEGYTCAITATDTIACWGYWSYTAQISNRVSQLFGPTNVVDIFAHDLNTCWVTSADIVSCIFSALDPNARGLLEDVHIPEGVKSMDVGKHHICILTNTNTVRCAAREAKVGSGDCCGGTSVMLGMEPNIPFTPYTLHTVAIPYNADS